MAKQVKLSDLTPDDKNFNKGSEFGNSLIEKSFRKFGAGRSILIDKNNRIIAGNKSVENAMAIGMEDVQIVESDGTKIIAVKRTDIDLDSEQGREMALADNASAKANIVFDAEVIEAELGEAVCVEWGIELAKEEPEAEEDEFDVPDGGMETDIVLGDLFEIGEHRLLCGDSTDSDQLSKLMNGQKANLSFTSPPYNAGKSEMLSGNTHTTDNKYNEYNDNQKQTDYLDLLIGFTNNALLFSDYLICNIQSLAGNKIALIEYLNEYKNNFIDVAIWDKGHGAPAMAENVMTSTWEYMFFISSKENASRAIPNANFRGTVPNIYRGAPNRNNEFSNVHAATFPIDLPEWALQFTKEKNIVLDQFLGTGTTMVASHQLKRKCYGMELDPKYCQVIIDRMIKLDPTLKIKRNGHPYEVTIKA
jgi:DNA modification methylase